MQEIRIALEIEINILHFALCVMIDILKRPEVRTMSSESSANVVGHSGSNRSALYLYRELVWVLAALLVMHMRN